MTPLDPARAAITRRAAMELLPGIIINLGVGMPAGIAAPGVWGEIVRPRRALRSLTLRG